MTKLQPHHIRLYEVKWLNIQVRLAIAMSVTSDNCKFNYFKEGKPTSLQIKRCCSQWMTNPRQNCQIGVTDNYIKHLALYCKYVHFYHTVTVVKLPSSANMEMITTLWRRLPSHIHNWHVGNV
jgi:hypothetical protein